MSTTAIEVLNRDLGEQSEKLAALEKEWAVTIREGDAAKRIIAEQSRRVDEVANAIDVLNKHEQSQMIEVRS